MTTNGRKSGQSKCEHSVTELDVWPRESGHYVNEVSSMLVNVNAKYGSLSHVFNLANIPKLCYWFVG